MAPELDEHRVERMDEAMVTMLRTKTAAERLAIAFDCNRTIRLRLEGHIRTYHRDWNDAHFVREELNYAEG